MTTISERIRFLRKAEKLTQSELASSIGLSIDTIRNYETGRREPNSKAMAILEKFFGVSGSVLRGEEEIPNAEPNLQNDTLARNLRRLRLKTGMTQKDFAECTGLSYAAIRSYEAGRREPGSRAMAILEDFFQVSGKCLRGETQEKLSNDVKLENKVNRTANQDISSRIKFLRAEKGLTQQQLAEQTGITYRSIVNYETGYRVPKYNAIVTLENFFQVSGAYLRGETDERMPKLEQHSNNNQFDRTELDLLYNLVHKEIMCAERLADIYDLSGKGNEYVKGELLKLAVKIIEMKEL